MQIKDFPFLLITLLFNSFLSAQTQDKVYTIVDQMPYFSGCEVYADGSIEKHNCSNQAVVAYLANNLVYPEIAKKERIEGIVYLSFIVDEKGKILRPTILNDIGGGCGSAAVKVVREMPKWQSGLLRNEKVRVQLHIPVEFRFLERQTIENYTFRWGDLETYEVTRKEIKKNLSQQVQVYNQQGKSASISLLTLSSNKKSKIVSAQSNGTITPQMKKLVKKLRKGSLFSVIVTIQVEGNFIEIDKEFLII